MEENKLSLHLGKTESILFSSKKRSKNVKDLNIKCNGVDIESKSSVKYLGCVLEQDLSSHAICTSVIKKVNAGLKCLYRKRLFLGQKERKTICSAFLQPLFDYACISWFHGSSKGLQNKLQICQNKTLRFIHGLNNRAHLDVSHFTSLKTLNVTGRVKFLSLNLMQKIFYNTAPSYMCYSYLVNSVHSYNTRNSNMAFVLPSVKSSGKQTFIYNGIKSWNDLPLSLKSVRDNSVFKSKCKQYLLHDMVIQSSSDFVTF